MTQKNPDKVGIYVVTPDLQSKSEFALWNGKSWELPGEKIWRRLPYVKEWSEPPQPDLRKPDRISASDRVALATRTEAPITPDVLARFQNVKALRLLHVGMGLCTEAAGEFMDMLKKHFFYGKPIDEVNAAEELGDLDWYMNLCCDVLHTTMAIIEVANIRKLATRYGDKFSEDKALLRNLSLELEGLQKDLSK